MARIRYRPRSIYIILLHLSINVAPSSHFYLEGKAVVTLCNNKGLQSDQDCKSDLMVFVNRLNTKKNILPYKYNDFGFCHNDDEGIYSRSLGQALLGDRVQSSVYTLRFGHSTECKQVCQVRFTPGDKDSMQKLEFLKYAMDFEYQQNWIVDSMPVAQQFETKHGTSEYSKSFPVGCYVKENGQKGEACALSTRFNEIGTYYLFNHIDITVEYHPQGDNAGRIVGVFARPQSIKHKAGGADACDPSAPPLSIPGKSLNSSLIVSYSYSVHWKENAVRKWSTRWEYLLNQSSLSVSWFGCVNSTMVVAFLLMILFKVHTKHLSKATSDNKDVVIPEDDKAWTLIDGDVFRLPRNFDLLCVFVSGGIQLTVTAFVTLLFAALGFLSPANSGSLFSCLLLTCLCLSPINGYYSAKFHRDNGCQRWTRNFLLAVFLWPGLTFLALVLLNCILTFKGSSAGLPFGYFIKKIAIWFGVTLPLVFVGAFCANRRKATTCPVLVNEVCRPIPQRSALFSVYLQPFLGGILPFGSIFVQLFFIFNTLWLHERYYTQFVQLFLTFIITVITCVLVSILLCFKQLQSQDYQWWWMSFLSSGWLAVYIFFYSIFYFFRKLDISDGASVVLYFGYTSILGFLVFLSSGSIGFIACNWIVHKMYSQIPGSK